MFHLSQRFFIPVCVCCLLILDFSLIDSILFRFSTPHRGENNWPETKTNGQPSEKRDKKIEFMSKFYRDLFYGQR